MTTAQDQQSRAAFERELIANRQFKPSDFCFIDGAYTGDDDLQFAWDVWQAARALPAPGVDPMLDTPAGLEPVARVCQGAGANIQWRKGMTYADLPAIDGQDLYTATQVQAMGRVPPGWQAVPVEPTREMVRAGYYQELKAAQRAEMYRAMLAAAPRPPVAQDELEIEQTRREAESLAWSLFNRHYAKGEDYISGRSVFGLCDSLRGVLSQIDNMTTGLVREPAAQERKPLTNEELGYIVRGIDSELAGNAKALIRAVERAHGIT